MLISESAFYKAKIGLVSTNTILKDLDESILKLKKQISRAKSELQIEELNLLTKKTLMKVIFMNNVYKIELLF